MSVGLPSDEVAEDYKNSLEDLTMNSRYEISNLTVIAKENTEHAMAISRVLENHIRDVSNRHPQRGNMAVVSTSSPRPSQPPYGCLRCWNKSTNLRVGSSGPQASRVVRS